MGRRARLAGTALRASLRIGALAAGVVVVVVVVVAAFVTNLSGSEAKPPNPEKVCPVARAPGQPAGPPQPYVKDAADYSGNPTHPLVVIDTMDHPKATKQDGTPLRAVMAPEMDDPYDQIPEAWQPPPPPRDDDDVMDYSKVQLVACVYYEAVGRPLTHCHYQSEDGTFAIAVARMTVVVREASTGRIVSSFPLRSDLAEADPKKVGGPKATDFRISLQTANCPPRVSGSYYTKGPRTWIVPPNNSEFQARLSPLVFKQF